MAKYDPRISEIVELIDSNNKLIYSGNWAIMSSGGWRYVDIIPTTDIDVCLAKIKDCQNAHGVMNVAIGHPMDLDKGLPFPQPGQMGLYVRDADELVEALRASLDDEVQVERWLNA